LNCIFISFLHSTFESIIINAQSDSGYIFSSNVMQKRQIKFDILLAAFAVAIAADSVAQPPNRQPESRPVKAQVQKARRPFPAYQRDPIQLVKEFYLDEGRKKSAFNLELAVATAMGADAWGKLDEKQRTAVAKAFEIKVNEVLEEWDPENITKVRVLRSRVKDDQATVMVLRDLELIRFSLMSRGGVWFVTEHEVVDDALPEFSDAIQGALQPGAGRGRAYELPTESALKYLDGLIAKEGESPQLLLLKYRVLISQKVEEDTARSTEALRIALTGRTQAPWSRAKERREVEPEDDRAHELLLKINSRWPDFTPGALALAFDLLYNGNDDAILSTVSKDAERAIAPLEHYIELVPYDPRPWRDLAHAYALLEKNDEAERAFRAAIERDPTYLDHYATLVGFHLLCEELEKAKASFSEMLRAAEHPDEAFEWLLDDEGFDPDYAKMLEDLLLAFPKELEGSRAGMVLLANAREAQNKTGDAIKAMQSAVAIDAEADDYEYLSELYRQQQRFTEALNAANHALKLDDKSASAQFERACSLSQLGRKREALGALKQMMILDPEIIFDPEESDLQPLANMPEFKSIKEKLKDAPEETNRKK
jgi:tetratricopeptide (TPR) repeat protein